MELLSEKDLDQSVLQTDNDQIYQIQWDFNENSIEIVCVIFWKNEHEWDFFYK